MEVMDIQMGYRISFGPPIESVLSLVVDPVNRFVMKDTVFSTLIICATKKIVRNSKLLKDEKMHHHKVLEP